MSDEMEIMEWFDSKWYGPNEPLSITYPTPGALRDAIREQLPDAVKQENDRAIYKALKLCDRKGALATAQMVVQMIDKYKPAQYCEGMQAAIEDKWAHKNELGRWLLLGTKHWKEIERCPFCKEGKNCIGGKE